MRPDADLDETLAPFNEQDEEYMEFVDKTDEVKEKWDKMPESCPSEGTFIEEIDRTDMVNEVWDEAADTLSPEDEDSFWKPYTKDKYPTPADIAKDKGYEVVPDETKRDGVRFVQTSALEAIRNHTLSNGSQLWCRSVEINGQTCQAWSGGRRRWGFVRRPRCPRA